ncbi:hypothetical protein Tco_1167730, partial [Tanacetum coccineum]
GVTLSGGHFVERLAEHFGLVTEEGLWGLTMMVGELRMIDMDELVRLHICERLGDTWSWVAPGPEIQSTSAPKVAEAALAVDEGVQVIPAPIQAPQPPHPAAPVVRTMPQRMARLEEEVYRIRESLDEQREVVDTMGRDFSRFTVWAARGISQFLDATRATYTSSVYTAYSLYDTTYLAD